MSGEDDPYVYPGTNVLKNRLNLKDAAALNEAERLLTTARIEQGTPGGDFDLAHLKAIHRHLFQDVYEWAGHVRTVEIAKGGSQFQPRQYIETGMADVHRRLSGADYLRGRSERDFAMQAGRIIGDVNYVHPFRDGNGRTQLQYLKQLGERAGHPLDLTKLQPERWIAASKEAQQARYEAMGQEIARSITGPVRERRNVRRDALEKAERARQQKGRENDKGEHER